MASGIDLIEVVFSDEKLANHFFDFLSQLQKKQLPDLTSPLNKAFFPVEIESKLKVILGYSWCFEEAPVFELLEITEKNVLTVILEGGVSESDDTLQILKSVFVKIPVIEYTIYSTDTRVNGVFVQWYRNGKEYLFDKDDMFDIVPLEEDCPEDMVVFNRIKQLIFKEQIIGKPFKSSSLSLLPIIVKMEENKFEQFLLDLDRFQKRDENRISQKPSVRRKKEKSKVSLNTMIKKWNLKKLP